LTLNIFNISKINSEVRGGGRPRIRSFKEEIRDSYFDHLAVQPYLVLIMDESHRYRAMAGVHAINELKPVKPDRIAPEKASKPGPIGRLAPITPLLATSQNSDEPDELDEPPCDGDIAVMAAPTASQSSRRPTASSAAARHGSRIEVPPGISLEEARRVLSAVASSAGTVARTGRTLTLDIGPAKRKGESRFHITKALRPKAPAAEAEAERPELTPAAARAALRRAYTRGADAAAELLAGPDMLSSDQIAERLGLSREAVLQKRRRGELLGIEGAKRGVRFPAWQVRPDGLPIAALRELHDVLGEPWAVFRFLRQQHPELGMQSGLQVAADRRRAAELVDLARSIGAFGPTGA
jgi:hypothetical protein